MLVNFLYNLSWVGLIWGCSEVLADFYFYIYIKSPISELLTFPYFLPAVITIVISLCYIFSF
jgi:hypothetical protein